MDEMRHKPLLGGKMAYPSGILKSLFSGRHNPCRITVDGELWQEGDLLLASLANGQYEGGGFRSAPRSLNDDGWIEVTAIRPISIVRFASIIGSYKNGTYLDRKKLQDIVSYRRAKHLLIESDHPFYIGIDGELLHGSRFEIENLPRSLRFIVPL
jgi:diacylglycerol kinase family enzyme